MHALIIVLLCWLIAALVANFAIWTFIKPRQPIGSWYLLMRDTRQHRAITILHVDTERRQYVRAWWLNKWMAVTGRPYLQYFVSRRSRRDGYPAI